MKNQLKAYQKNVQAFFAGPDNTDEVIDRLFEKLELHLRRAHNALQQEEGQVLSESLDRALKIIDVLMIGFSDTSSETAREWQNYFSATIISLSRAVHDQNTPLLETVIQSIVTLRDLFRREKKEALQQLAYVSGMNK